MRSYRTPANNRSTYQEEFVRGFGDTYEICDFTPWASVSTVPAGGWARGTIVRGSQPVFYGPSGIGYYAYDPSDPVGWVSQRG